MKHITLESGHFGWDYILRCVETNETLLIQSDWDYPGVASSFGFVPCAQCDCTDGTVDCAHKTVLEMITEAQEFLDSAEGEVTEDPGYFAA